MLVQLVLLALLLLLPMEQLQVLLLLLKKQGRQEEAMSQQVSLGGGGGAHGAEHPQPQPPPPQKPWAGLTRERLGEAGTGAGALVVGGWCARCCPPLATPLLRPDLTLLQRPLCR